MKALCNAMAKEAESGRAVDLFYGFRCMSMDVVTYLCFGESVDAIHEPRFEAPILVAMDSSMLVFSKFKYSHTFKDMMINCPPGLAKKFAPETAGMIDLQQVNLQSLKHRATRLREKILIPAYREP